MKADEKLSMSRSSGAGQAPRRHLPRPFWHVQHASDRRHDRGALAFRHLFGTMTGTLLRMVMHQLATVGKRLPPHVGRSAKSTAAHTAGAHVDREKLEQRVQST